MIKEDNEQSRPNDAVLSNALVDIEVVRRLPIGAHSRASSCAKAFDQSLEFQRDPDVLEHTHESRPADCVVRFAEVDEACVRRYVELPGVVEYLL